jgi:hypothetical protein
MYLGVEAVSSADSSNLLQSSMYRIVTPQIFSMTFSS